jgi:hypothetical protein
LNKRWKERLEPKPESRKLACSNKGVCDFLFLFLPNQMLQIRVIGNSLGFSAFRPIGFTICLLLSIISSTDNPLGKKRVIHFVRIVF